jgi:uncharacterized membrane protein YbhN (UPF0104 family)
VIPPEDKPGAGDAEADEGIPNAAPGESGLTASPQHHEHGDFLADPAAALEELSETAPPEEPPPALGQRLASGRTIVSLVIAAALIAFFIWRQDPATLAAAWELLRSANPWLYLLALGTYYLAFPIRGLRWRVLLVNIGTPREEIPRVRDLAEIIYLSWFVNSIVPAKLGDVYRGWLLKKTSSVPWSNAMGTIVAERMLDVIVLVVLMVTTGLLTYGNVLAHGVEGGALACIERGARFNDIGCTLFDLFLIGGILVLGLVVALVIFARYGAHLERYLPHRLADLYARFASALVLSFGQFGPLLGLSILAWFAEGMSFWLVGLALGQHMPIPLVIFFSMLQAFITAIPLTPGGLGFEPVLAGALRLRGYTASFALAMTGLYRTISYLSLVIGGAIVYIFSKKTK